MLSLIICLSVSPVTAVVAEQLQAPSHQQAPTSLDWPADVTGWSELVRNGLTAAAIIVGGVWTWLVFVRTRQRLPRVDFVCRVARFCIDETRVLFRVTLVVENKGVVLLSMERARVWLQRLKPWDLNEVAKISELPVEIRAERAPSAEGEWPLVGERDIVFDKGQKEIEPGETDELSFDFVLEDPPEILLVYAYLSNRKKARAICAREIGWEATAIHDVKEVNNGQGQKGSRQASPTQEEAPLD
jgi:hypothetical protein